MATKWTALPLNQALFANLDPDAVVGRTTGLENGFINEQGTHTRFWGLEEFCTLPDNGRVYLFDFQGDLVAATSNGRIYRISQDGTILDVTGVPIAGGRRVIFAKDKQACYFAAGGPLTRLAAARSDLLLPLTVVAGSGLFASDAINATHVAALNGYVVAPNINSQEWLYSNPGFAQQWPVLNTFSADSNAGNITALMVTPMREMMFAGPEGIEQWEPIQTGTVPFFRRWSIGGGIKTPYAFAFVENSIVLINKRNELVKLAGQTSQVMSNDFGLLLETIDDWTDAWIGGYPDRPLNLFGQKFLLIQMPNATNAYGTKGVTLLYDTRANRFSSLYGFDQNRKVPARWPGWSHWTVWDQVFVGGEGVIYKFGRSAYSNAGVPARWLVRTAHIAQGNALSVDNFRLQCKRGGPSNTSDPKIRVRCRRDARAWSNWVTRSLGQVGQSEQMILFGPFGTGSTFMFEIECADDTPVNLIKAEVWTTELGH